MGVGKLGLHEQFEFGIKSKVFTSEFENFIFALNDERPRNDGHQDSIDAVTHVLNHRRVAMLNGNLQLPVDCLGSQSKTLEFILLFLLPDPRNTLKLRIDNKGISLTVGQDSTILN